jgi:hypothetical protein
VNVTLRSRSGPKQSRPPAAAGYADDLCGTRQHLSMDPTQPGCGGDQVGRGFDQVLLPQPPLHCLRRGDFGR